MSKFSKKMLFNVFNSAKDTFWNSLETAMVEAYQVHYQYINPLINRFYDPYQGYWWPDAMDLLVHPYFQHDQSAWQIYPYHDPTNHQYMSCSVKTGVCQLLLTAIEKKWLTWSWLFLTCAESFRHGLISLPAEYPCEAVILDGSCHSIGIWYQILCNGHGTSNPWCYLLQICLYCFSPHRKMFIMTCFTLTRSRLVLIQTNTLVRERYHFRCPMTGRYLWRVLSSLPDRYLEWSFWDLITMWNSHE